MNTRDLAKNRSKLSISTAVVVVIVVIIIIAAAAGGYVLLSTPSSSTTSSSTTTTTITITTTSSPTTTTSTTTTSSMNTSEIGPYTVYLGNIASSPLCNVSGTYPIGVLTDLTDGLSSEGIRAGEATLAAVSDVNTGLAAQGCKARFTLQTDDYKLDPTVASSELSAMAAAGVKVVVGPLNSGTAIVILPTADSDHIVLVSPSSTAISLHIPNDYLFRTAPSDTWQALADARELWSQGIKSIVVAHVHDTYGDNLANTTAADFVKLGGTVANQNNFFEWSETQTDFATIVPGMNTAYTAAVQAEGGNKSAVAIYIIAFEESVNLFTYAHQNYPGLLNSTWYGSDGTATDTVITNASTSGNYVAQVKLPSTEYAPLNSSIFAAFSNQFQKITGFISDGYATGSYDDVWLAALSVLAAGSYDGPAIQAVMANVSAKIFGVTGYLTLDSAGDRLPTNGYDVWKVVEQNGTPTWVISGHWGLPDNITWTSPP